MLDRVGAKRPVVLGCVLGAVGFYLWAGKVTEPRASAPSSGTSSWPAPAWGFMLGPASTDAVNRASRLSYGEATGITQTVRNYAASLGLAILGTILVSQMRSRITTSLIALGVPSARAHSRGVEHLPVPGQRTGQRRRRSRTSSGSTSPTPRARCST